MEGGQEKNREENRKGNTTNYCLTKSIKLVPKWIGGPIGMLRPRLPHTILHPCSPDDGWMYLLLSVFEVEVSSRIPFVWGPWSPGVLPLLKWAHFVPPDLRSFPCKLYLIQTYLLFTLHYVYNISPLWFSELVESAALWFKSHSQPNR